MAKIKIPSKNIIISGNHLYKGYYAEYRSRLRQGEFLIVHLGCNGHEAAIPIGNVVFIMNDGRFLQYRPVNNGLSLFEVGKEDAGEVIVMNEEPDSPTTNAPLYVPTEENIEENIEEAIEEAIEEDIVEVKSKKRKERSSSSGEKYAVGFHDVEKVLRQEIPLDSHPVTEFLSIFFKLLEFDMDHVAINSHSTLLQGYLKHPLLKDIVMNTELYKTFVIAYVFIYINNFNIGYTRKYHGCVLTPNDDPGYILCIAIKSGFITIPKSVKIDITYQITALLNIMGTKLVPSNGEIAIYNRFSLLRINDTHKKTSSPAKKKSKMMIFPLIDNNENLQISTFVKNTIFDKINYSIKNENKDLIEAFKNNFDYYVSGIGYRKLVENSNSMESKLFLPFIQEYKQRLEFEKEKLRPKYPVVRNAIFRKMSASIKSENEDLLNLLKSDFDYYVSGPGYKKLIQNPMSRDARVLLPYINEYKKRVNFEKDKFYDNMSKTVIMNNIPKNDKLTENLKDKVVSEVNSKIIDKLNNTNVSYEEHKALEYVLNNSSKIVELKANDIKDLNISILSANPEQKSTMSSIVTYKKIYDNLIQKFKKDYHYRLENKQAESYKKQYSNTIGKTLEELQKLQIAREKRRKIDSSRMKIFEEEKIISQIKSGISDILDSGKYSQQEYIAYKYLLDNLSKIVDITDTNLKKQLETNFPNEKENSVIIKTIKFYREVYQKMIEKTIAKK